jgi:hypothetical protein
VPQLTMGGKQEIWPKNVAACRMMLVRKERVFTSCDSRSAESDVLRSDHHVVARAHAHRAHVQ